MTSSSERIAVRPTRAAELTDTSRSVIYQEMSAGRLPFVEIGRSRRILVSDLVAWLSRNRQAAADEPDADDEPR